MEDDQELERKAIEELLKEAKRGKTRAETMGPMGCCIGSHAEASHQALQTGVPPAEGLQDAQFRDHVQRRRAGSGSGA
ncbi:uncharacterized protein [Sagmatias obliquidens]|uniref:uncharacterized protein isoform X4 n=1 Tax=Sagmatias obliquidens TaxID=3371155 RepID=UPI000F444FB1|nr:uncharacterized protein LOC113625741 isoform X4 [Lagenorhynchus obliquidens]